MVNTELLKSKIGKSGYKLCFVAKKTGISRYSLYLKMTGKKQFGADEIAKLCSLLGINDLEEKESIFFAPDVAEMDTAHE